MSGLHHMRLLRVIEGAYSAYDIMTSKDGYIGRTQYTPDDRGYSVQDGAGTQ